MKNGKPIANLSILKKRIIPTEKKIVLFLNLLLKKKNPNVQGQHIYCVK